MRPQARTLILAFDGTSDEFDDTVSDVCHSTLRACHSPPPQNTNVVKLCSVLVCIFLVQTVDWRS